MSIIISDIKQKIWHAAKCNLYLIIISKVNIHWDFSNDRDGDYEKLLAEVERMRNLALSRQQQRTN